MGDGSVNSAYTAGAVLVTCEAEVPNTAVGIRETEVELTGVSGKQNPWTLEN